MTIDGTFRGAEDLKPGKHFSLFYQQEEEKRLFLKEIFSLTAANDWSVLYLRNQSATESLLKHGEDLLENVAIEPAKDFFLSKENFSLQKAIEKIMDEREEALFTHKKRFCLLVEMDYVKDRENDLLQFESFLSAKFLDDTTLPITQYQLQTFPIPFLAQALLFHQNIIIDHGISVNHNPLQDSVLQANTLSALFHHSLDNLRKIQEIEEGIHLARDLCLVLFEEFPNPIFLANTSGEFIDFNHAWLVFTGKKLQEEKEGGWLKGLKEKDRDSFLQQFQKGLAEKTQFEIEFHLLHHSGNYRYILCSARPISRFSGHFAGFLFSCYDITHRQEKEDRRIEELEKELTMLNTISGDESTRITASSLGLTSIKEGLPDVFSRLTADYHALMEDTITEHIFGKKQKLEEDKRAFVNKLGFLQASPRDLIDIHSSVLEAKSHDAPEEKAFLYVDEGRILVLEIMGYLTSFYRKHCSGFQV